MSILTCVPVASTAAVAARDRRLGVGVEPAIVVRDGTAFFDVT